MASLNALLAGHGDALENSPPDHLLNAPTEVRRRVAALKGLQMETIRVQAEFYERIHQLEVEFRPKYNEINNKRTEIVAGQREPTDAEATAEPILHYLEGADKEKFDDAAPTNGGAPLVGVPDFWLNVLRHTPSGQEMITEEDEPILKHLRDIVVENVASPPGFTITFHFAENDYFSNTELKKEYVLSLGPNKFEPAILYDGPSVIRTNVCQIDWKEGKDVTKKVDTPSFFHYFTPPAIEIGDDLPEESAELLNTDFEFGQALRESIVDNAVLYYTGEIVDTDDFDYGEDFDEDDDEDDE